MKNNKLLGGFTCLFLLTLLCHPQEMLAAGEDACFLWLERVLPSLFPFLVGCQILLETGFAEAVGSKLQPLMHPIFGLSGICALPFFLGILSGYPMGAKITATLYQEKKLSLSEAQHILAFSNNAGPLFIVGTVATGFFMEPFWGYILLFCSVLGAIITGILYRFICPNSSSFTRKYYPKQKAIPKNLLPNAIINSLYTACFIGGYILLFSILVEMLSVLNIVSFVAKLFAFSMLSESYISGILGGFLEMTTGIFRLSTSSDSLFLQLLGTCFLLAFGGCSILGQTFGVLSEIPINKKKYIFSKIANALFSCLIFSFCYPICIFYAKKAIPATYLFTEIAFSPNFNSLSHKFSWCFCLFALLYAVFHRFHQRK